MSQLIGTPNDYLLVSSFFHFFSDLGKYKFNSFYALLKTQLKDGIGL